MNTMSNRDKIGALILIGLMFILMLLLFITANEPIGSGQYFDN